MAGGKSQDETTSPYVAQTNYKGMSSIQASELRKLRMAAEIMKLIKHDRSELPDSIVK